jgi:hypothetical protein
MQRVNPRPQAGTLHQQAAAQHAKPAACNASGMPSQQQASASACQASSARRHVSAGHRRSATRPCVAGTLHQEPAAAARATSSKQCQQHTVQGQRYSRASQPPGTRYCTAATLQQEQTAPAHTAMSALLTSLPIRDHLCAACHTLHELHVTCIAAVCSAAPAVRGALVCGGRWQQVAAGDCCWASVVLGWACGGGAGRQGLGNVVAVGVSLRGGGLRGCCDAGSGRCVHGCMNCARWHQLCLCEQVTCPRRMQLWWRDAQGVTMVIPAEIWHSREPAS